MLTALYNAARYAILFGTIFVFLAALIAPPFTYFVWREMSRIDHIRAGGSEAMASIVKGRISSNKGDHYAFDLAWRDGNGALQAVEDISASDAYGAQIASRAGLKVKALRIKYLPQMPAEMILLDDAEQNAEQDSRPATVFWGEIVSIAALVGLVPAYFLRRRVMQQIRVERAADPAAWEAGMLNGLSLLLFLLFWGLLLSVVLSAEGRAKNIQAFGATPFGLPVGVVVPIVLSILYLPLAWPIHHLLRFTYFAQKARRRPSLAALVAIDHTDEASRFSIAALVFGSLYFFGLCALWIAYTAMKGI